MTKNKNISIIIPAYNAHKHIKRCLDSIVSQIGCVDSYEIIISDDNSVKTYDYLMNSYQNLKIIKNDHNEGAGVARQLALNIASGEWISFVDADDIVCNTPYDIIESIDNKWNVICHKVDSENGEVIENTVLHGKIYRKSFLDKHNIRFDKYLRICEDSYFNIIAYKLAKDTIYHTEQYGYILTDNKESTTNKFQDKSILFSLCGIDYWDALLRNGYKYLFDNQEIINNISCIAGATNNISDLDIRYGVLCKLFTMCDKYNIHGYQLKIYNETGFKKNYNKYIKEKNRKYLISVVIPVYNSAMYLEKCLTDLYRKLGKFEKYAEIICVDDYSTDAMEFQYILSKFANKTNLSFHHYKENVRMGRNRNRGIELAKGEWIVFLDHDDYFIENTFDNFFAAAMKFKNAKIIRGCAYVPYEGAGAECFLMELIHGIFYKRSFLIDNDIRFTDRIDTSEDVYFNHLAFFTAQNKYGFDSICTSKLIRYMYNNKQKSSTVNKYYNGRSYFEEFLLEYINSVLMPTFEVDGMTEDDKLMILLNMIFTLDYKINSYKDGKNFKSYNIKLLCGVLLILNDEFGIKLNSIYTFINSFEDRYHLLYKKRFGNNEQYCINVKLKLLPLCIKMIDIMEKSEKEYLINLCKYGIKEVGKYV